MDGENGRGRVARSAAERALVRVVHHYGATPEFVVLGGLVPELLCSGSDLRHAGTSDVDVQVDLEIACGAVNATRLERALRNAEFEPDAERTWRWSTGRPDSPVMVKFELLADLDEAPAGSIIGFDGCKALGAVNLRGSGFASRDLELRELTARIGAEVRTISVNVAGLAGFLLAKNAAAHSRRLPKDWYDLAYVLLHNDEGGPEPAARRVLERFAGELAGAPSTGLRELAANFENPRAQGTRAYVAQVSLNRPEVERHVLAADAILAVTTFCDLLLGGAT